MKFSEFGQLFFNNLEISIKNAENMLEKPISKDIQIRLYGAGYSGDILTPEDALQSLFLCEDKFYRIIDMAVQEISPSFSRIFIRVSAHQPVSWDQTWNTPLGNGPFKQILALIRELSE